MRRKELEITDIEAIESIIKTGTVCNLGLADDGEAYVVPVFYGYERGSLYFHSAIEGKKLDILRKHNRVAFEISTDIELLPSDVACKFTARFRSVMGTGNACILTSDEEKVRGLKLIMEQYGHSDPDFPEAALKATCVIRVDIETLTGKIKGY